MNILYSKSHGQKEQTSISHQVQTQSVQAQRTPPSSTNRAKADSFSVLDSPHTDSKTQSSPNNNAVTADNILNTKPLSVEDATQRAYDFLKQGRYAEALPLYQYLAEQGNAIGQLGLGILYDFGQGVAQNYSQAVYWYTKSAEQGNATAQGNLGFLYHEGRGVTQNDSQAVLLYNKSAEQGYATAQANLGFMYQKGQGVAQDFSKAVYWFRKAAEQGVAIAQSNLGVMYDNGQDITQDYNQAFYWYN